MINGYLPALAALAGSAVGGLATVSTTWITQRYQDRVQRLGQEASRREHLFGAFIEQASSMYAEALSQASLDSPGRLVNLYATINKMRLFASPVIIGAAESVLTHLVETYNDADAGKAVATGNQNVHDILRHFTEACRAELDL